MLKPRHQYTVSQTQFCKETIANDKYNHILPFNDQYMNAKQKVYDKYHQHYPKQEKQNLYKFTKNPHLGYYIMKGYRPDLGTIHQNSNKNANTLNKSSEKVIKNMIKRYLDRKEISKSKEIINLPSIEHSISVHTITQRSESSQINKRANKYRIKTDHKQKRIAVSISQTTEIK